MLFKKFDRSVEEFLELFYEKCYVWKSPWKFFAVEPFLVNSLSRVMRMKYLKVIIRITRKSEFTRLLDFAAQFT